MTKLEDIFDIDLFHERVGGGFVRIGRHSEYPYSIANYTQIVQFNKEWDEVTSTCRGLIFNHETMEVVARPFLKFFNHTEVPIPSHLSGRNPDVVAAKADGSLGIIYPRPDGDGYDVATRGSFVSEQALWATNWLNEMMPQFQQPDTTTTLCEIIFPQNRIVVDYSGVEQLLCLGAVEIPTGVDVTPIWWDGDHVDVFDFDSIEAAAEFAKSDEMNGDEGVVVTWRQDDQPSFRLKVKHPEYVRLHQIPTGTTARSIWDAMRNDSSLEEFLEFVPDEFYDWVLDVKARLEAQYDEIVQTVKDDFFEIAQTVGTSDRAAFARLAIQKEFPGLLFLTLDGNQDKMRDKIWDRLRPAHEIPFVNETGEEDA